MHRLPVRMVLAVVLIAFLPQVAEAQNPRLVRVIWDVGNSEIYYKDTERVLNQGTWTFPTRQEADWPAVNDFVKYETGDDPFLEDGDHVRVYITNYNPVSHVPGQTAQTVIRDQPPAVSFSLLNLLALLSSGTFAGAAMAPPTEFGIEQIDPSLEASDCESLATWRECFAYVDALITNLSEPIANVGKYKVIIDAIDERTKNTPANQWDVFKNAEAMRNLADCLDEIVGDPGYPNHVEFFKAAEKDFKILNDQSDTIAKVLGIFDAVYIRDLVEDTADVRTEIVSARERFGQALVSALTGPAAIMQKTKAAKNTLDGYDNAWKLKNEAKYVVEVPISGAANSGSVVVVDQTFKSPDRNSKAVIHKTLDLPVAHAHPVTFASVGLAFTQSGFGFAENTFRQEPGDPSIIRWEQAETGKYQIMTVSLLTHFRIKNGFYGSIGTTADRNIFRNIILGGSYYHPQWRTVFTVGTIAAKGATVEDLALIAEQYSNPDGTVIAGTVPAFIDDEVEWHWKLFVGVGLKPF